MSCFVDIAICSVIIALTFVLESGNIITEYNEQKESV